MDAIKAYLLGMREFRSDLTTGFATWKLDAWYDRGRDMAHRLTFRRYDHTTDSDSQSDGAE